MPRQLSVRATVVVVSLLFSVCFAMQARGRSSSPKAAVRATPSPLVERPGAAPKLSLVAAQRVPALRDPRKPKPKPKPKPRPKPKPKHHKVVAAPKPAPVQVSPTTRATPIPTPAATAAPRPRYVPPARAPAPTPKATPAPSGSFDTSGAE